MKPIDASVIPLTTPSNPYQQRAASAYKTNGFQGMSEREMMAQVFQKSITHLYTARDAFVAQNLEFMVEQSAKVIHIFDVLREELRGSDAFTDPEAAVPATFLLRSYAQVIERVANVLSTPKPEEEFDAIIALIKPIYQAWQAPKDSGQPADATPTDSPA